jgi:hypothetical protein
MNKTENDMHSLCKNAFSKVLVSSVVALMATTSLSAAATDACAKPQPVCCEEPKPGPFAFAFPYDGGIACPRDFNIHAEFLALQAKQGGMDFAIQDASANSDTNSLISHGRVAGFSGSSSDWDYNYGARFGLGFNLDHDAWNVDFSWTWLDISNYKYANASTGGGGVIPQFVLGNVEDSASNLIGPRSSAVWDGSINLLDATLGKAFHVSRYLVVNPFFGVRGGWIDQHFSVDYQGAGTNTRVVHHSDNDFWGFGARAGLNTNWMLGKGWSLFGNVASTLLFGKFDVKQNLTMPTGVTTTPAGQGFDLSNNFYMNTPGFEIALGLSWDRHFLDSQYAVSFKAGYEFQVFADQLNIRKFSNGAPYYSNDVVSRGDLTLNGFTLRAGLDL